MEIQQGKFVNGSVVADTVEWKSTPENWIPTKRATLETKVLLENINGFLLDDVILPPEYYVTGKKKV